MRPMREQAEAEAETKALREQVKLLTIDEAKRQLELEQYEAAQRQLSELRNQLSEQGNALAKLQSQNEQLKSEREDLKVRLQHATDGIGSKRRSAKKFRQLLDGSQKHIEPGTFNKRSAQCRKACGRKRQINGSMPNWVSLR